MVKPRARISREIGGTAPKESLLDSDTPILMGWRIRIHYLLQGITMTIATRSLTNPYALRILRELSRGPTRFNALDRAIDMKNPPALSALLKKLARDDAVERVVLTLGPPPAVEYRLTRFGAELAARVKPLLDLLDANEPRIERARAKARVETEAARAAELTT
jgi:DNA-binding HxlR family transcriptional regulator